jgi:HSP20 family protein
MFAINGFENSLFHEFHHMEREMERLLGAAGLKKIIEPTTNSGYPQMNIGSTQNQVDIYLFAAGIDTDTLDISLDRNQMTVKGKIPSQQEEESGQIQRERFSGDFHRIVNLPDDIDAEKVVATYQNGVIHIIARRRESSKPRQITIQ